MRHILLAASLASLTLASCTSPTGICDGADVSDAPLLGTLEHRGVTWRVQQRDLPDGCGGVTTWDVINGNRVTFDVRVTHGTTLHELGHVLLGTRHLREEDEAVMSAPIGASDLTPADIAYCLERGICDGHREDATSIAERSPADVVAWAAQRWSGVVKPEFRITFTEKAP